MQVYAGIDLHSNNSYLGIRDEEDRRLYKKRLPNQGDVLLAELAPFRQDIRGIRRFGEVRVRFGGRFGTPIIS